MTPEALRIARELADLLAGRTTAPPVEPPARCNWPARPLSREERELAAEQRQLLRDFQASRYYARLRIKARRMQ